MRPRLSCTIVFFKGMANSARKLIARREYFSLLPLLPVLKYLGSVLIKFSKVLKVCKQGYFRAFL